MIYITRLILVLIGTSIVVGLCVLLGLYLHLSDIAIIGIGYIAGAVVIVPTIGWWIK